jgi:hypothetical protein
MASARTKSPKRINHGKQLGLAQRASEDRIDTRSTSDADLGLFVKVRDENDMKMS